MSEQLIVAPGVLGTERIARWCQKVGRNQLLMSSTSVGKAWSCVSHIVAALVLVLYGKMVLESSDPRQSRQGSLPKPR